MKNRILHVPLIAFFFVIGWFGTIWVKSAFFEQDVNVSDAFSDTTVEKLDDSMLPPKTNGFVVSAENTEIDGFLTEVTTLSLESILQLKNDRMYQVLMEDYFNVVPENAIADVLLALMENNYSHINHDHYRKVLGVRIGFSIWLKRNFESAKQFALGYCEKNNEQFLVKTEHTSVGEEIVTELFKKWIEKDKEACLAFIEKSKNAGSDFYAKVFVAGCMSHYPAEVYSLSEKYPELLNIVSRFYHDSDTMRYEGLFINWYMKDPAVALEKALAIKYNEDRTLALKGILSRMSVEHPGEAVALIEKIFKGDKNYRYFLHESMLKYAKNADKSAALDFINQGDFSDEQRTWLYQGLAQSMNSKEMNALLDRQAASMTEEEVERLIKAKFSTQIGFSRGNSTSFEFMAIDNDSESMATLLSKLNDESKADIIRDTVSNHGFWGKEWILDVYKSLPDEKIDKWQALRLLQQNYQSRVGELVSFYVERIYGNERLYQETQNMTDNGREYLIRSENEQSAFISILNNYMDRDEDGAKTFIASLTDPVLKQQAETTVYLRDWDGKNTDVVNHLESLDDTALRNYGFEWIASKLSRDDPQALASILVSITDTKLAESMLDRSGGVIYDSEDSALDFIEGLANNKEIQAIARKKLYETAVYGNPKLALELALEMSPGKETDKKVRDSWEQFRYQKPKTAERWAKENNHSFDD